MNENNLNWFKDEKTWLKDLIISGEIRKQKKKDKIKQSKKEWLKYCNDMESRVKKGLKVLTINNWRLYNASKL